MSESEEYVKLTLDTYNELVENSRVLNEIKDCINAKTTIYNKEGNKISDLWNIDWFLDNYERIKTMEINLEDIIKLLGYNSKDYKIQVEI